MGLQLRNKGPKRKGKATLRINRVSTTQTNQIWAMDVVDDKQTTGRKIRILILADLLSRISSVTDADFCCEGEDVVQR